MLTFHHLDPRQNNVLNAKMSTLLQSFLHISMLGHTSGIFLFFFFFVVAGYCRDENGKAR